MSCDENERDVGTKIFDIMSNIYVGTKIFDIMSNIDVGTKIFDIMCSCAPGTMRNKKPSASHR